VLTDYLGKLCAAEGIAVEAAVLPLVVRAGAGSVRDSLSVLDQLLGGADESGVGYRQATALLGYTPDSLLDEFVDAFAAGDAGGVFSCVDKVIEVGQDPRRFAEDLLRRLRDLVIVAAVPDALTSGLVDAAGDQGERLASQAAALGPGELTRAAEVLAVGLTEMRGTTAPRLHLELMCARVVLPGADVDGRGIHARLDRIERRLGVVGADGAAPAPARAPARQPSPPNAPPAEAEPAPAPSTSSADVTAGLDDFRGPAGGETDDTRAGSPPTSSGDMRAEPVEAPPAAPTPAAPAVPPEARLTVTDVRRLWPEVLEEVKGKRRFTWILLSQNAQVTELRDNTLLLAMSNAGARDSFGRGGSEDVLREAIVVVLGADFRIETMVDPSASPGSTPRTPPAAEPAAPAPPPTAFAEPVHPAPREQARQSIRPTRTDPGEAKPEADDRDADARRDDTDLDDAVESPADLLARHLDAEIITDDESPT
jgi:DNA polymerase-3 subunit gamma/tau